MQLSSPTSQEDDLRAFPPTMWTVLLAARDPQAPQAVVAREEICRVYWHPIFSYLQSLGLRPDEAEDVTQALLAQLCRPEALADVDRSKGRLRHFLKAAARHALCNFRRDARTQKRGGGAAELPVEDLSDAEAPAADAPSDGVFDRQWAWAIFDRAMTALEASYAGRGKAELFAALRAALIAEDAMQPYSEIGSRFGVGEPQIRIEVHRLRRRMAERLRAEVTATLAPSATAAEIEAELRYLVQTLAYEPAH